MTVYPSDYGLQRMAEEAANGPQVGWRGLLGAAGHQGWQAQCVLVAVMRVCCAVGPGPPHHCLGLLPRQEKRAETLGQGCLNCVGPAPLVCTQALAAPKAKRGPAPEGGADEEEDGSAGSSDDESSEGEGSVDKLRIRMYEQSKLR